MACSVGFSLERTRSAWERFQPKEQQVAWRPRSTPFLSEGYASSARCIAKQHWESGATERQQGERPNGSWASDRSRIGTDRCLAWEASGQRKPKGRSAGLVGLGRERGGAGDPVRSEGRQAREPDGLGPSLGLARGRLVRQELGRSAFGP